MLVEGINSTSIYQGLPKIETTSYLPGVNTTYGSNQVAPMISNTQSWWESIADFGADAADAIGYGLEKSYEKVSGAVGRVTNDLTEGLADRAKDVLEPVKETTSFAVVQVVILVAVLGVALYYTGKSGGLRVSV